MSDYNDGKWTLDRVYYYARGYYDGRSIGVENKEDIPEQYYHEYNTGYECGVTDYCEIDNPEDE